MNKMMQADENQQQTFDETTQAYLSKDAMENVYREENALKLDVSNNTDIVSFQPDPRWHWATPDWNDRLTDTEIFRACGEVSDTLRQMLGHTTTVGHPARHHSPAECVIFRTHKGAYRPMGRRHRDRRRRMPPLLWTLSRRQQDRWTRACHDDMADT